MELPSSASPPISHQSLPHIRSRIRSLEDELQANGAELSGRIIHVCHYLPVVASLNRGSGLATPPGSPKDDSPSESKDDPSVWTLSPRYGHAAMISGIRSLSNTHEQLIIGWTGDIVASSPSSTASGSSNPSSKTPSVSTNTIPATTISDTEKQDLDDALKEYTPKESHPDPDDDKTGRKELTYVPVWMNDKVAHGHYDGYCKQILWPLFHYLLWQDVATEYASADMHYPAYVAANEAFAKRIAEVYKPGDLIWVHDYHLLLTPKLARDLLPDAVIGLFVHTPFPSSEVFRCLPRRKEILDGMLGANLICFQTYSYTRHFTSTCIRVCGYEASSRGIDVEGHVTAVSHCPVGIDADRVSRDVLRPGIQPKLEALRTLYEGKKIIVGRDKLDVVKGVLQKLRAFEHLLRTYPEWIGKVVMIQVTSPALSDSPKLERMVTELVSRINGEYGSLDFIPCHHYHQTLKKDEFYALLSVADLAVITPLRDGMNTTSMEFVIAQARTGKNPSVLSEFMGISKNMSGIEGKDKDKDGVFYNPEGGEGMGAMMVNPWDLGDVAAAMHRGLTMSPEEKLERHNKLMKVVTTQTSQSWAATLVKMLLNQLAGGSHGVARRTPELPRDVLKEKYNAKEGSGKRLFLFDYDGTLAPIVKVPSMAVPTEQTLYALRALCADPRNVVYIISGRDQDFLEQHLGDIEGLGFSAEHGGFIREPGTKEWMNFTEQLDMDWMKEVGEVFRYYTERTTGSNIEIKKSSITWHYRGADPEWGQFQCRQCQDLLENNLAHKRPIEVLVGKKNLEVRPLAVNKGEIVKRILYHNPDAEFVFCAGDDKTDEDMFRALLLFSPLSTASSSAQLSAQLTPALSSNGLTSYPSTPAVTSNPTSPFPNPSTPNGNDNAPSITKVKLEVPLSVTLLEHDAPSEVELAIRPDAIFTTAVGHSSKRTLASWHVTTPGEVVDAMISLVDGDTNTEL
ncbi:glycosyltransferase family 20 protein [Moniliophthora roreri]|uniref:Putative trehalose 6-phosphate phosphatase, glycosyltransferase family 20 protein n=1 Tax=Moniliophthora roreri TaxID=221103 RepID=A0A0W0FRC9_MONRR|nr:glycosyltransferase family 20 protein [Moniliophthora roreri]